MEAILSKYTKPEICDIIELSRWKVTNLRTTKKEDIIKFIIDKNMDLQEGIDKFEELKIAKREKNNKNQMFKGFKDNTYYQVGNYVFDYHPNLAKIIKVNQKSITVLLADKELIMTHYNEFNNTQGYKLYKYTGTFTKKKIIYFKDKKKHNRGC